MKRINLKNAILILLKVSVALICFGYLISSGKIDFSTFRFSEIDFFWLFIAAFGMILEIFLSAMRWKLLLQGSGIYLSFKNSLSITWIGQFVGGFLMGVVGMDLVRSLYASKFFAGKKRISFLTVALDRMLGMCSLILVFLSSLPFVARQVFEKFKIHIIISLCLLGILLVGSLFIWFFRKTILKKIPLLPIEALKNLLRTPTGLKCLIAVFGISFVAQAGMVLIIFSLSKVNGPGFELSIYHFFWISPLVLIASALPISPAGIGVGQVVLAYVFQVTQVAPPSLGVTTATCLQLTGLLTNSLGVVPYFKFKSESAS